MQTTGVANHRFRNARLSSCQMKDAHKTDSAMGFSTQMPVDKVHQLVSLLQDIRSDISSQRTPGSRIHKRKAEKGLFKNVHFLETREFRDSRDLPEC